MKLKSIKNGNLPNYLDYGYVALDEASRVVGKINLRYVHLGDGQFQAEFRVSRIGASSDDPLARVLVKRTVVAHNAMSRRKYVTLADYSTATEIALFILQGHLIRQCFGIADLVAFENSQFLRVSLCYAIKLRVFFINALTLLQKGERRSLRLKIAKVSRPIASNLCAQSIIHDCSFASIAKMFDTWLCNTATKTKMIATTCRITTGCKVVKISLLFSSAHDFYRARRKKREIKRRKRGKNSLLTTAIRSSSSLGGARKKRSTCSNQLRREAQKLESLHKHNGVLGWPSYAASRCICKYIFVSGGDHSVIIARAHLILRSSCFAAFVACTRAYSLFRRDRQVLRKGEEPERKQTAARLASAHGSPRVGPLAGTRIQPREIDGLAGKNSRCRSRAADSSLYSGIQGSECSTAALARLSFQSTL
uniref:Uncharacterized protein n=1 Tax=Trichogramma kaykai TaxID=54128 RepID=A0ABD2W8S1_9HYME